MSDYPTRPLETWDMAKDLRRKLFWNIWNAHDEGKLLVQGVNVFLTAILAGIGDATMAGVGPNFGTITRDVNLLRDCHNLAAQRGYRENGCASMRMTMGALFKDIFYRSPSGEQVKPDLCLDISVCPHQVKGNKVFKDHYQIPHLVIETPAYFEGDRKHHHDFLVTQLHEAIEWMEKTFSKEYDDEKLIEATYDEWDVATLFAKCADTIKNIPAPIDSARFYPFVTPILRAGRHHKAVKEIFQMLLDELNERVREGIAIVGNEKFRLVHEGNMPYFWGNLPRMTRQYGATLVGGRTLFALFGAFTINEDGSWQIPKTPRERGVELRNRDDALRALADLLLYHSPTISGYQYPSMGREAVWVAKHWQAEGAIMHIDRGCRAMTAGVLEVQNMLEKNGIRTMTYEGNTADPRDFHQQAVEERVETFLSSLGLSKLPAFN